MLKTIFIFECFALTLSQALNASNVPLPDPTMVYRSVPPELEGLFKDRSEEDDGVHCMKEFRDCFSLHTNLPLCAQGYEHEKKQFKSICEMKYENCINNFESWHYLSDGDCQGSNPVPNNWNEYNKINQSYFWGNFTMNGKQ